MCNTQKGEYMELSIISSQDVNKLAELFMNTFNSEPWNDNWQLKTATQRIALQVSNPNSIGIKVIENEEIIGFVLGYVTGLPNGKGFFIEDLCVSNCYQNKGIGKMLMNNLENELNKKTIELIITTTAKGFTSHSFYLTNGFFDNPVTVGMYKVLRTAPNMA